MKKLLSIIAMGLTFIISTAQNSPTNIPQHLKNKTLLMPERRYDGTEVIGKLIREPNPYTSASPADINQGSIILGETTYDLQTNASVQNRVYKNANGILSAVWTQSHSYDLPSADRGTGYNFFDQTNWLSMQTTRIESQRTGWPSLTGLANGKEYIIAHNSAASNMQLTYRSTAGTGTWTEDVTSLPSPVSAGNWFPRIVSGGTTGNSLHTISVTQRVSNGGSLHNGQDGALCYSRSQDGGQTWDIINQVPAQLNSTYYKGFIGDNYTWAEPRGNTLAYVVGGNFQDVVLMKSTNNGTSWTKTIISEFPYPFFDEATTLVTDTPNTTDGSFAALIDNNDEVHVFWGAMRVNNEVVNDGQTNYFPYTDGLCYWRESMGAGTEPDTIAFSVDYNINGTLDWTGLGLYYVSTTSFPSVAMADNGTIYVTFSSLREDWYSPFTGTQNYRGNYILATSDGGNTWTDPLEIDPYTTQLFTENVFGFLAPQVDDFLHFVYQADYYQGMAVKGDLDGFGNNWIVYQPIPTSLPVGNHSIQKSEKLLSVYPNPNSGCFTINLSNINLTGITTIEIYNAAGQLIKSETISVSGNTLQKEINLNSTQGIYSIRIISADKVITEKLIVK